MSRMEKLREEEERIHSLLRDETVSAAYKERLSGVLRYVHLKMAGLDA